jgi:NAD(P)-dependent dehydrogenase (short-subunit alcohol dehydrogenase family)
MSGGRVIILGAASAVAEALARLYAADGADLVLVGRRPERLEDIARDLRARGAAAVVTAAADLAQAEDAEAQLAAWRAGAPVEGVYLFYGVLPDQARAEADLAYAGESLAVNFTSAALWCLAAARLLEDQGRGVLVATGSVAGDRGRQSNYVYGAAKAGLGALVQGIAHRFALRRSGARAVLIKPGFIDSPMTERLPKGGPLWAKPEAVARRIRRAADGKAPIVYAPGFWRPIMLVIRLIPASIFHRRPL